MPARVVTKPSFMARIEWLPESATRTVPSPVATIDAAASKLNRARLAGPSASPGAAKGSPANRVTVSGTLRETINTTLKLCSITSSVSESKMHRPDSTGAGPDIRGSSKFWITPAVTKVVSTAPPPVRSTSTSVAAAPVRNRRSSPRAPVTWLMASAVQTPRATGAKTWPGVNT